MKKTNKKRGFTIVELVIVIAVIAILAAVLIPTFSNVISRANQSKALQETRNAWTNQQVMYDAADSTSGFYGSYKVKNGDYTFYIAKGTFEGTTMSLAESEYTSAWIIDNEFYSLNQETIDVIAKATGINASTSYNLILNTTDAGIDVTYTAATDAGALAKIETSSTTADTENKITLKIENGVVTATVANKSA